MTFYSWLKKTHAADGRYKDLYDDAKEDKDFPKRTKNWKPIITHLWNVRACMQCRDTFWDAYAEYVSAVLKTEE